MAHLKECWSGEKRSSLLTLNLADYPHIPSSDLFKLVKKLPKIRVGGPWIAGGSVWRTVNNEPLNKCDVDVFFPNKKCYEDYCAKMNSYPYFKNVISEKRGKWNTVYKVHVNEGSYNKTFEVQFIGMKWHSKLEKLLESFDFSVCKFGFNGTNIQYEEMSLDALEKRMIYVHRIDHPKTFLNHLLKYLNNGFTIPPEELKTITKKILDMDGWKSTSNSKGYDEVETLKMVEEDDERPRWGRVAPVTRRAVIEETPIQPMNLPTGNVFYADYRYGAGWPATPNANDNQWYTTAANVPNTETELISTQTQAVNAPVVDNQARQVLHEIITEEARNEADRQILELLTNTQVMPPLPDNPNDRIREVGRRNNDDALEADWEGYGYAPRTRNVEHPIIQLDRTEIEGNINNGQTESRQEERR